MKDLVGHPERLTRRWHLVGAGVDNVWHYTREVLSCPSGRCLLRGSNGTGKTTLLEGLCPYLLNPTAGNLSSGRNRATSLESLMKGGSPGRRRFGYLWLSFASPADPEGSGQEHAHYGVRLEYAQGSGPNTVTHLPFRVPVIPGDGLEDLSQLSKQEFTDWATAHGGQVFARDDDYVADLAQRVFGCGPDKLKQLARSVKKLRNPGLLTGLTPADAATALRGVLPRVSPQVMRDAENALVSVEATRVRYVHAQKTTALLQDLSDAWMHSAARIMLEEVEKALACGARAAQAQDEAARSTEQAGAADEELAALTGRVAELTAREGETASRAKALEADAASSDMGRASERAESSRIEHERDCELLEVRLDATASDAETLQAAGEALLGLVEAARRTCESAGVPVTIGAPVSVSRTDGPPVVVGDASFRAVAAVSARTERAVLDEAVQAVRDAQAWQRTRSEQAHVLVLAHADVEDAEGAAAEQRGEAVRAADTARQAALRHQTNQERVRERILTLSTEVQAWTAGWSALLRTPLLNADTVMADARSWVQEAEGAGVIRDAKMLARTVAAHAAGGASRARSRAAHHQQQAGLASAAAEDAAVVAEQWRAGRLPPFPGPWWLEAPEEPDAFACAVDWNASAPAGPARDALEAVIAATGLLSAVLTDEAATATGPGRSWRVLSCGEVLPAHKSLASILTVVPGHPLAASAARVLERIAYLPTASQPQPGREQAALVIGADGTYRAGLLAGRLPNIAPGQAPVASHIGLQARRAAARRAAAEAQRTCERWQRAAAHHLRAAHQLSAYAEQIQATAQSFPHPALETTADAEATRAESAGAAHDAHVHAAQLDRLAQEREAAHRGARTQWRARAAAAGLPDSIGEIRDEADAACRRVDVLEEAARQLREGHQHVAGVAAAAGRAETSLLTARESITKAQASFVRVRESAAALEACRERSGKSDIDLARELAGAKGTHAQVSRQLVEAHAQFTRATGAAAAAREKCVAAGRRHEEARPAAQSAAGRVRHLLNLGGLAEALEWQAGEQVPEQELFAGLRDRLKSVAPASRSLDACSDVLRLHLAGESDEGWHLAYGDAPPPMPAHQLVLAGRRLAPPQAAREAALRHERALAAYDSADADALEEFVLSRIPDAISTAWVDLQDWVKETNGHMRLAAASSGVGVQIKLSLRKDLSPAVATIHELTCKVSSADRSPEQERSVGQALLAVMRLSDAGTGRTTLPHDLKQAGRLDAAIDIRDWVTISYMITRPDGSQERWGAPGVTISQGESRLIVLAPMLAALAAEYDDLPSHAARLCALDEVPGDVDEKGRDGIAAYTASLGLDLMCTSHHWDGSPGAWDGIDIYDLEKTPDGTVVAEPMHLYEHSLLEAVGDLLPQPAGPLETVDER